MQSSLSVALLSAVVLAAGAASAQNPPAGYSQQQAQPTEHPGRLGQFLSPELRVIWHDQHRDEMRAMSFDQRHAYRRKVRQQLLAMAPSQKAELHSQLQEAWNQLPPEKQQSIEQRLAQRAQRRQSRQAAPSGGYGAVGHSDQPVYRPQ